MNTVTVKNSKEYQVLIGTDLIGKIGDYVSEIKPSCTAVIISDSNVWPIYGNKVSESLCSHGFTVMQYIFPAGEASKNSATYVNILEFLAENNITRSDMIIALGGGVTGDMAGFVAATYLRGISYIQVPTSLLAMVDSSVGGKTAIDLSAGKNLAGAFYQPALVLCDTASLKTLSPAFFLDGCAEVIKYAILYDPELFDHLKEYQQNFDANYVITRCVALKSQVVQADEFDKGARQKLNLGHTFGHSIEQNSHFTVSHGLAVAKGMVMSAAAARHLGFCSTETQAAIHDILVDFGFPLTIEYTADEIYKTALSDKKRFGDYINLVFPEEIGRCILQKIPIEQLRDIIEAGLK